MKRIGRVAVFEISRDETKKCGMCKRRVNESSIVSTSLIKICKIASKNFDFFSCLSYYFFTISTYNKMIGS